MPIATIALEQANTQHLEPFLQHLNETVKSPDKVEVLISVNKADQAIINICQEYKGKIPLKYALSNTTLG